MKYENIQAIFFVNNDQNFLFMNRVKYTMGWLDLHQRHITGVRRVLEMSYIRYQRMRILSPGVAEIRHYVPVKEHRLQPVQYGGQ